jgi:hypothetical protein
MSRHLSMLASSPVQTLACPWNASWLLGRPIGPNPPRIARSEPGATPGQPSARPRWMFATADGVRSTGRGTETPDISAAWASQPSSVILDGRPQGRPDGRYVRRGGLLRRDLTARSRSANRRGGGGGSHAVLRLAGVEFWEVLEADPGLASTLLRHLGEG